MVRKLIIDFIDASIPLGCAVLLLAFPQWFVKKDLEAFENLIYGTTSGGATPARSARRTATERLSLVRESR